MEDKCWQPPLPPPCYLEQGCIVPDVIPCAPKKIAQITYPSGCRVLLGNILTPTQVKDQPVVNWDADPKSFYTLIFTDPDAPSRTDHKFREWHHWIVGNIPGEEIEKGQVISEFISCGPPKDTGLHRYVFVIYKQKRKTYFDEVRLPGNSAGGRENFNTNKFAAKYHLGCPVAANYFQSEYDDYVPELYKYLSRK